MPTVFDLRGTIQTEKELTGSIRVDSTKREEIKVIRSSLQSLISETVISQSFTTGLTGAEINEYVPE